MRFRRKQNDVCVGLDLSPGRIKLVGISEIEDRLRVVCAVDEVLPGDGLDHFDTAAVGAHVALLLSRLRVRPKAVALVLGPGDAVARRLAVVDQEHRQMLAAVAIQLGQVLGGDVAAPRVGFTRLSAAAAPGRVAVLAGAARPEAVLAQQRAVAAAGCEQGPVTAAAAGLVEAWRTCQPAENADRRVVLLHVGESAAVWVVLDRGEPLAMDAPLVGLASARDRVGRSSDGKGLSSGVVSEWVTRIHQEIARGLQSARRDAGDRGDAETYEIWVSGGGSRVPGFHERLEAAAGARVRAFDPLLYLDCEGLDEELFGPALVPAVGAALQALASDRGTDRGFDLRLAPERAEGSVRQVPLAALGRTIAADRAFRVLGVLVIAAIAGVAALNGKMQRAEQSLAAREARVRADSGQVAVAISRTQLLDERRRSLGGQLEAVRVLDRGRLLWPEVLAGVAAAAPPTAWVSDVVAERENPTGGGATYRVYGYAATDAVASSFAQGLIRHAAATEARVERTALMKIGRIPVVFFEIAATAATPVQQEGDQ